MTIEARELKWGCDVTSKTCYKDLDVVIVADCIYYEEVSTCSHSIHNIELESFKGNQKTYPSLLCINMVLLGHQRVKAAIWHLIVLLSSMRVQAGAADHNAQHAVGCHTFRFDSI